MTAAGEICVPSGVKAALETHGMAFDVCLEETGPFVEVVGNTNVGGEMIHVFDFRGAHRSVGSVRDWRAEALEVFEAFDAFDVACAHAGVRGAPEGEDLYKDIWCYKKEKLRPLVEAIAAL